MNLQELKNIINKYKDKFNLSKERSRLFKPNRLLFKEINNQYPKLFNSITEFIYLIKNYNNLENLHIFCYCGNKNKFTYSNNGYAKYCSHKCSINNIEVREKFKQTCLKKYGVDNPFKNKSIIKKMNQTKLNDIDENGLNSYQRRIIKSKQTKLKRYGNKNYNNSEKCKQTRLNNIDENGLNSYFRASKKAVTSAKNNIINGKNSYQRIAIKRIFKRNEKLKNDIINGKNGLERLLIKINQTKRNNIIDDKNSFQRAAIKGVVKRIKEMNNNIIDGKNSFQRAAIKCKQTKLNDIDENGLNNYQRASIKCFETKKKNNSFNKSEGEEEIYKSLLTKFPVNDIIRQYRNKLYPFHCDFYIKSLDLYIEYHGMWTHGSRPFKNSIENVEQLNEWKNKNTKFYNNAINTWTNLDVKKLQTFKKNKLNHHIFYNLDQFYNWFNKI